MSKEYNAKSVKVLSALEAFREKIGMYCGSAGLGVDDNTGVVKTALEIIDNSIDEAMNGYATDVKVTVKVSGNEAAYIIEDNGRGIPVDKMDDGRSALEVLLTEAHSGSCCPLV